MRSFLQDRAMRRLLAQFFIASTQGLSELPFKPLKIAKPLAHIRKLCLQSAAYRCAGLHAVSSQLQQASDFAELEAQTLYAAYERQRLDVAFAVLPKASLRSWSASQQRISLVEANRVRRDSDLFRNPANVHSRLLKSKSTPWSK